MAIWFIIGMFAGERIGVTTMCGLQINRIKDKKSPDFHLNEVGIRSFLIYKNKYRAVFGLFEVKKHYLRIKVFD